MKTKLLMLKPKNLKNHPKNMRRFYPDRDVSEMAASILAAGRVVQPLIVVEPAGKHDHEYVVVDGNLRLTAARTLGEKCPPLECKVVGQDEGEQLLEMAMANGMRYDVDPVSEGLHYKRLQDEEGLSIRDISKRTGLYEARITKRRVLADLPKEIQQLIVEGRMPADDRAARALLQLPREKAVRLAERLAQNDNLRIKTVLAACEKLAAKKPAGGAARKRPAAELSGALNGKGRASASDLRAAAKKACHSCNQYEGSLRKTAEPAWAMVVHAADKNCLACPLKDMQNICGSCPAVQLLKRLVSHE